MPVGISYKIPSSGFVQGAGELQSPRRIRTSWTDVKIQVVIFFIKKNHLSLTTSPQDVAEIKD